MPLRIETGRYEGLRLGERRCFQCTNMVESEEHALLHCPLYSDIRERLFQAIRSHEVNFDSMSEDNDPGK